MTEHEILIFGGGFSWSGQELQHPLVYHSYIIQVIFKVDSCHNKQDYAYLKEFKTFI